MGCSGSKSTPVVEANSDVIKNGISGNGTLIQKVEDIVEDVKENVTKGEYTYYICMKKKTLFSNFLVFVQIFWREIVRLLLLGRIFSVKCSTRLFSTPVYVLSALNIACENILNEFSVTDEKLLDSLPKNKRFEVFCSQRHKKYRYS